MWHDSPSRERSVVRVSDSHFTNCAWVSRPPHKLCARRARIFASASDPHTRGPKSGGPQFLVSHSHAISRRIDFVAHSESNLVVSLCERELPPGMQAEQLRRTLPLPLPKREGYGEAFARCFLRTKRKPALAVHRDRAPDSLAPLAAPL